MFGPIVNLQIRLRTYFQDNNFLQKCYYLLIQNPDLKLIVLEHLDQV